MVGEILDNLIPPFNLETFNHSGEFSYSLLRFLKKQPSIIKLGFGPMDEYNYKQWYCAIASGTPILPNLTHLGGSLRFTAIMMPRCPISSINASSSSRSTMEAFGDFIARSMVPITRIRIVEDTPGLAWVRLLMSLRAHHTAASNLRELTVDKIYTSGVDDAKRRSDEEFLLSSCSTIFHFDALEKLEFNIVPFGQGSHHGPTPADACTWLAAHGMQDLSAWRVCNPSLRTVVVYGHVVPEAQPT
ncbi:unnamed protein product [Rhizoctonia solani]|uniref:Uncharacterized protein n=1 Tax=Rhizoctonia solani TaxID=456999 RepID=A0A8H3C3H0_9AGAM|nr:unnamed protein product [Rhizoctonia solani]